MARILSTTYIGYLENERGVIFLEMMALNHHVRREGCETLATSAPCFFFFFFSQDMNLVYVENMNNEEIPSPSETATV